MSARTITTLSIVFGQLVWLLSLAFTGVSFFLLGVACVSPAATLSILHRAGVL